jgi:hypothetical protein
VAEEPHHEGNDEAYHGLRLTALEAVSSGLIAVNGNTKEAAGLIVDIPGGRDGFATLVALRDGTSSLYVSTGGGVIGAGFHQPVQVAAKLVLTKTCEYLPNWRLEGGTEHPLPHLVKLFGLTSHGRRVTEVPEAAFWGRERHAMAPLIAAIQALISAVRAVSPE